MVFYVSVLLTVAFIIWGIFFTDSLSKISTTFFNGTLDYFGWIYLSSAIFFVIFSVYLLFSKFGHIRLGKETEKPEFKTASWLAMLFGAGTGVGIIYWSVAEPVFHYTSPPSGEGNSEAAANLAMEYTFFHWGFHPWAIYTVIGLALAYFQFNKRLPASVSSAFYPLLKEKIHGPIGKTIDILAVFATIFGIATSLGLGSKQISAGLNALFGIPNTLFVQIIVIAIATILFIISLSTGLKRGIQYLSNTAMILSFLIMFLVLVLGPTSSIFKVFFNTMGGYASNFIDMSLNLGPFGDSKWIGSWTLFYWAWWIAWAPFVGMFIARISKGRTIKEFVIGVLFVPSLGTFAWLSIFGGSALHMIHNLGQKELATQITSNVDLSVFSFFEYLPASSLLSIVGFAVMMIYYITVADTSTFVLGMLSERGNLNPTNKIKVTWGIIQSMVASVLLLAGGLQALQTASIVAAFPFAIIMVVMCWSLFKALKDEVKEDTIPIPKEKIIS
ncbi:glycine/betaine ABC transporter permease [Bacillus sp. HMSC76G11]|nr:glycine/betaine ABC transporter permease [Bacillus sp. HMSC76G11]